jgi:phosphopantothenoylcysteine decarboxylase/phosphopantothenate--cysteine ligase
LSFVQAFFKQTASEPTNKKRLLITAGPTLEHLDPVRYISNHSTGAMGFALAKAALMKGYEVLMIAGPSQYELQHPNFQRIDVQSAEQMLSAVQANWSEMDLGIFTAAVADYRAATVASDKIKKSATELSLELIKNPDILAWASANRKQQQVVGFALETNNQEENALKKLHDKNLDFVVLNTPQEGISGFGSETNIITIFGAKGQKHALPLMSKFVAAQALLELLDEKTHEN